MKNTSRSINLHGGIEKIDPNISIPDTWAENSNRNIQDSQSKVFFQWDWLPHKIIGDCAKNMHISAQILIY
jgi:hypothetical protein